jgi:hypothetical protein
LPPAAATWAPALGEMRGITLTGGAADGRKVYRPARHPPPVTS